ncbi:UDP-glucose 4-epimerase [Mycobacterium frederiksbergense]|jgi:nucleoside-diphosphate-sugar epimerase|uniref:UDP-glucose 4-epimerase n=1 Tax=Mycolicibacterium frederiksbergense TaxID=117567 RepID=A0ABT6KXH7_9MYCO|nr:NAD-dependent epimerase/dehydratase family protein [Mycolicibacterium frederiksbergense]MDH6195418.1 UDP-glucose 4-epimerase [Mycolicibacterium frederiksbergense]
MRVVVTGGAGRLGRYVCSAVMRHHEVIVADRAAPAVCDGRVVIDVLDVESLRRAFAGADAVIHLAGVDYDFHERGEDTMRVNALGTWNVLEVSAQVGVRRVVLCSSVAAMGLHEMREDWKPLRLPITEEHPVSPVEPYSVSKAAAETMARSFVDGNALEVVCLRPCTVVTADNLDELLDPDGQIFLGEYIAATDCGEAFLAALEAAAPGFGPYLVAADDTLSPRNTLEFLSESLGALPGTVDHARYRANPRASAFDTSAVRQALDWSPRTTRAELRTTLIGGA